MTNRLVVYMTSEWLSVDTVSNVSSQYVDFMFIIVCQRVCQSLSGVVGREYG